MRFLINFVKRLYISRSLIWSLAIRAIADRYAGTIGSFIWSIINPLVLILVYWFVFSVGFKVKPMGGAPYIVVFLCGFIPWTLLSETVIANANAITNNPHLVKKIVFPTEILPVVNLVAGFITHIVMIVILLILLIFNKMPLTIYALQFFYFLFGLSIFCLGLGWIVSSLNVFYRDTAQVVGVILNIWFWFTPIVWDKNIIPQKLQWLLKVNPMFYMIEGYKGSFIYPDCFLNHWHLAAYYWVVCLTVFVAGGLIFKRFKPEFADVI